MAAPPAVKVADVPAHTAELDALAVTVGTGLTVTDTEPLLEHEVDVFVITTEYTVDAIGISVTVAVVAVNPAGIAVQL